MCLQSWQRRHHRAENAGIDHRSRHTAALVDAQDHIAQGRAFAPIADARLRDYSFIVWLIVLEIDPNRAIPVNLIVARAMVALRTVQRAHDRLPRWVLQTARQILDYLADNQPRGFLCFA